MAARGREMRLVCGCDWCCTRIVRFGSRVTAPHGAHRWSSFCLARCLAVISAAKRYIRCTERMLAIARSLDVLGVCRSFPPEPLVWLLLALLRSVPDVQGLVAAGLALRIRSAWRGPEERVRPGNMGVTAVTLASWAGNDMGSLQFAVAPSASAFCRVRLPCGRAWCVQMPISRWLRGACARNCGVSLTPRWKAGADRHQQDDVDSSLDKCAEVLKSGFSAVSVTPKNDMANPSFVRLSRRRSLGRVAP